MQRYLRYLKSNGKIDKDMYNQTYPTCSQQTKIYGPPKMHKIQSPNVAPPFPPIVASLCAYDYRVAEFLCSLLQPHLPSKYTISISFSFLQQLDIIDVSNKFMVSFDVVSLFTNIPLKECIDLAISYVAEGNTELTFQG